MVTFTSHVHRSGYRFHAVASKLAATGKLLDGSVGTKSKTQSFQERATCICAAVPNTGNRSEIGERREGREGTLEDTKSLVCLRGF